MFFNDRSVVSLAGTLLVAWLTRTAFGQDTSLTEVKITFDKANIPKDADIVFKPTSLLEVSFPQASGSPVKVKAGVQLARNETAIPPTFAIQQEILSATPRGSFVVAMVDLDAPTPQDPSEAQIRHFLGGNFQLRPPNSKGLALLKNTTAALSNFIQPTPPAGSDPHRYVFLLFKQPPGFNKQTELNATTSVANFNISQFAKDTGLGNPLGGSFILVGPDPTSS